MGLLPLTYRRPAYVDKDASQSDEPNAGQNTLTNAPTNDSEAGLEKTEQSLKPVNLGSIAGIPPALSFDKIIEGGTCPPCTVRDFMNYLIYVERSAENLQFFLWYRDYVKRFEQAKTWDLALAPEWTPAMEEEAIQRIQKEQAEKARSKKPSSKTGDVTVEIFKGTDFEKGSTPMLSSRGWSTSDLLEGNRPMGGNNPFGTPPDTPRGYHQETFSSEYVGSSLATTYGTQASDAFTTAGVKPPCKHDVSFLYLTASYATLPRRHGIHVTAPVVYRTESNRDNLTDKTPNPKQSPSSPSEKKSIV